MPDNHNHLLLHPHLLWEEEEEEEAEEEEGGEEGRSIGEEEN